MQAQPGHGVLIIFGEEADSGATHIIVHGSTEILGSGHIIMVGSGMWALHAGLIPGFFGIHAHVSFMDIHITQQFLST
jgi:hypothetical protein